MPLTYTKQKYTNKWGIGESTEAQLKNLGIFFGPKIDE